VYIGRKSRTERPKKTKIGSEVAHVTRDLDVHHFQGHQAALLTAAFTHRAAAAVSLGTYSPCEPTATLPSAGAAVGSAARGASAPTEGGEERGISWRPPAYSLLFTVFSAAAGISLRNFTPLCAIHASAKLPSGNYSYLNVAKLAVDISTWRFAMVRRKTALGSFRPTG